jgi:hypothetical protein
MENKEKLVITTKEAKEATIHVAKIATPIYSQSCLLCENIRNLPEGMHYCNAPWVCDECKEAIAFVKEFKAGIKEVPANKTKEIEASIALL